MQEACFHIQDKKVSPGRKDLIKYMIWIPWFSVIVLFLFMAERENCIHCGLCSKACPMGIEVQAGVEKGNTEHPECILCGECACRCPKNVLRLCVTRGGWRPGKHAR